MSYLTSHFKWATDLESWVRGVFGRQLYLIPAYRWFFVTCEVKLIVIMCVSLGVRWHFLPPFETACCFNGAEEDAEQVGQPPGEGTNDDGNHE